MPLPRAPVCGTDDTHSPMAGSDTILTATTIGTFSDRQAGALPADRENALEIH